MKILKENNLSKSVYKTAIILLNWNGCEDTNECLISIKKYCTGSDFVVVLVDNDSSQSIDLLLSTDYEIPFVFIKNDRNDGFAAGNNIGIKKALQFNPEYVLLLNNDTVLIEDILSQMTYVLDNNPAIGVTGVVNYYFSEPHIVWQAGLFVSLKTAQIAPAKIDKSKNIIEVDYVPGSSLMFRSTLLHMIGFLDENYFAYYEEVDFCLKTKMHNYKVVFLPNTKLLHKVGQASSNAAKEYLRLRNRLYLFNKYSKKIDFFGIIAKEIVKYLTVATKMFIKSGKFEYYIATYKSVCDFTQKRFGKGRFEDFLKA
jgi:GT2 family glycosyltransferase